MTPQEQPDSLRDILQTLRRKAFHDGQLGISYGGILDEAEQAIKSLIATAKPEKRRIPKTKPSDLEMVSPAKYDAIGHNKALDEYEAALLHKLEGKE